MWENTNINSEPKLLRCCDKHPLELTAQNHADFVWQFFPGFSCKGYKLYIMCIWYRGCRYSVTVCAVHCASIPTEVLIFFFKSLVICTKEYHICRDKIQGHKWWDHFQIYLKHMRQEPMKQKQASDGSHPGWIETKGGWGNLTRSRKTQNMGDGFNSKLKYEHPGHPDKTK